MGKVIADLASSATSATFNVENATSSVDYVISGTDGSANQVLKTDGSGNLSWAADAGGLFSAYAIITDEKVSGSGGGTFTTGAWRTRDLNTEVADPGGIVSLSTNQFTLAAGSYLIQWSAPAFEVTGHQTRLYDITGTSIIQYGSNAYVSSTQTTSIGSARVTPSGSNAYELQHLCGSTRAVSYTHLTLPTILLV